MRSEHRVVIARLPDNWGAKWYTSCTRNHFVRISASWESAWMWAEEHCPVLATQLPERR